MWTKLLGWAGKFNLGTIAFKIGACVAILSLVSFMSYREGVNSCQESYLEDKVEQLGSEFQNEITRVEEEISNRQDRLLKRMEDVLTNSEESQKLRDDLRIIRGKLDEAIKERPASASCSPSDNELRYYDGIAEKTRS